MTRPVPTSPSASAVPPDLHQLWDAIVVGTGPGGAAAGLALAEAGKTVLFLEEGGPSDLRGSYPELLPPRRGAVLGPADAHLLRRAGRYEHLVHDTSGPRPREFVPFIGAGPGGSSALYGMALERFLPQDFEPAAQHPGATVSTQVDAWPIRYADLAPFYAQAEQRLRVRGEIDPLIAQRGGAAQPAQLLPAPALSPHAQAFSGLMRSQGLHPYRLPAACEALPGCTSCQGYLCAQPCKNDAQRSLLQPALQQPGGRYLGGCRVTGMATDGRRVTGVLAQHQGQALRLQARTVILAAGALQTPLILLRSRNTDHPDGLGNRSGWVGRNLMRHFVDLYLVQPDPQLPPIDNRQKEIAFNDFYLGQDAKLGTVQSFGSLPPPAMLVGSLQDDVRASALSPLAAALPWVQPLLAPLLGRMMGGAMILATITEDLPYADNAVRPASHQGGALNLHYRLQPEAHRRVALFRKRMRQVLQGQRWRLLPQADNNQRLAHACGTCRMGDDAATSVLDRQNRVHGLDNLFVVDSASFPSSGGTNPSLTIMAQALRVGQLLVQATP